MALKMIGTSDAPVSTTDVLHPAMITTNITNETKNKCTLQKGWAQRPLHGKTLGKSTIHLYVEELQSFLMQGSQTKGAK